MSLRTNNTLQVKLNANRPTTLSFRDLHTWTIWQFPRKKRGGLCGAVRPPITGHSWYPAIIRANEKKVQVHAHLDKNFSSPEAAAEHLEKG